MGDQVDSIDEVLLRYQNELVRYCKWIAGSSWDAEDLFQITLMRLYQTIRKRQGLTVSKAYLFRVATNAWIDICRKQKIPWEELGPSHAESVSDPAFVRESMEELVDKLTPQQACMILLVDIFRFTPKETAAMVDSTEGAVKAILHRARTRMKMSAARPVSAAQTDLKELIELFISAFNTCNADLICRAYFSLRNAGYEVVPVMDAQVVYFRCQDPEGNVFYIYTDADLGANDSKIFFDAYRLHAFLRLFNRYNR